MFVIGTSLQVHPFASLPGYTLPSVPRVLFNYDEVEGFGRMNDASVLGDCDESVWTLCQKIGWHEELKNLHEEIGGVERKWDTKFTMQDTEAEGTSPAEETVEQLTKQLAEELRLDKEEDVEVDRLNAKDREVQKELEGKVKGVEGDKNDKEKGPQVEPTTTGAKEKL